MPSPAYQLPLQDEPARRTPTLRPTHVTAGDNDTTDTIFTTPPHEVADEKKTPIKNQLTRVLERRLLAVEERQKAPLFTPRPKVYSARDATHPLPVSRPCPRPCERVTTPRAATPRSNNTTSGRATTPSSRSLSDGCNGCSDAIGDSLDASGGPLTPPAGDAPAASDSGSGITPRLFNIDDESSDDDYVDTDDEYIGAERVRHHMSRENSYVKRHLSNFSAQETCASSRVASSRESLGVLSNDTQSARFPTESKDCQAAIVPRLSFQDITSLEPAGRESVDETQNTATSVSVRSELDDLVSKHQERQVAAAVTALKAGSPTRRTQVLAYAEGARRWIMGFPSIASAVQTVTTAAAQRTPDVASELVGAAAKWVLDELHQSEIAAKAFARPEVFLLEAPESHCPQSPSDALDTARMALKRGSPSLTIRAVSKAENMRRRVMSAWCFIEHMTLDALSSPLAHALAKKMQHCAAISEVYDLHNPRALQEPEMDGN